MTMMLAAVDDRLAAAVVSCGNTENFACADFNPPGSTDDAEQDFIGAGPLGFDRWDLLYPLAPKPLKVLASARDSFGTYSPRYLESGREEFGKLQRIYKLLGHEDRIAWVETPLPHGLAYGLRLHVYDWFERWLRGSDKRIETEPEVAPEKEEALRVGPSGNVFRDFGAKKPQTLAIEALGTGTVRRGGAGELIKVGELRRSVRSIARIPAEHGIAEGIEIESAPGVFLPAWRFTPPRSDRTLIILEPRGRNARWREGELYPELARGGITVVAADLRGLGDLTGEVGRGNPFYTQPHASEEDFAWASLMLGEPLLAQRVNDIVALLRAHRGQRVILAAAGHVTVPALWAASIEPGADTLFLSGGLTTYRSIVETEEYRHTLANFLPGVLKHTDLPQIAGALKLNKFVIAGAVDAAGKPADPALVQRLYPKATVRPGLDWTANFIASL